MPCHTVSYIANKFGLEFIGNGDIEICGVKTPDKATHNDLVFFENEKNFKQWEEKLKARAVLLPSKVSSSKTIIIAPNIRVALAKILYLFVEKKEYPSLIDKTIVVGENTIIPSDTIIMHNAYIGKNVKIGSKVIIYPNVVIEDDVEIGDGSIIYSNVVIRERCIIGKECIIHPGAVIGADGFGFVDDGDERIKIPQIGIVRIGDRVEIGANTTIDRATLGETYIGDDTKIDNLVHIAHNCYIGKKCYIAAQTGIAGSTRVGDFVMMGGQVGIADHITIGDGAILLAQSGISHNIKPKEMVFGTPAREVKKARRINAIINSLPDIIKRISELEKRIS
jgi:UDP-3-O-[3-hydroxymyristoyl] glucosamine N-acyltransferase